jgi:hypothetical protein
MVGEVRFVRHSPRWRVNDRMPIPKPEGRPHAQYSWMWNALAREPVLDVTAVPTPTRAQNVSSLGEVPDSTWFENRIGRGGMTPAEVARGPARGPPFSCPCRVEKTKEVGHAAGIIVEDAAGTRYVVKFDYPYAPELETGAEAVVARLLYAAGYHVPQNDVVFFGLEDLELAEDASHTEPSGDKVPLTRGKLESVLADAPRARDGRLRAMASEYLPGEPLGGYAMRGTRPDDPNDRVPHQHRRDVRGLQVFYAWVGNTDVKETNTLDMWNETEPGRGYVVHYLLDFGKAFGGKNIRGNKPHDGFAHVFDYKYGTASFIFLGLWKRPWEGVDRPELRGAGTFQADRFEPERFRPTWPYIPFRRMDRFDGYWAAKIVSAFTLEHLRAAVFAGHYSDPRTTRYLVRTLRRRQEAIVRHWFGEVAPVDRFRIEPGPDGPRLCGEDLLLARGFGAPAGTRYEVTVHRRDGTVSSPAERLRPRQNGSFCTALPATGPASYRIVVLRVRRGERTLPAVEVHLEANRRVLGVWRH